jgi:hypothetical protein
MVQAFLAETSNPTFSKRPGVWSLIRCFDWCDVYVFQQFVKALRITSVVIVQEEPGLNSVLLAFPENMTSLLFEPFAIGENVARTSNIRRERR